MGVHRGVWQVGIAVLYLGLIVVLLQVLMVVRTITQQQGSVWGARGQLLLFPTCHAWGCRIVDR
jgi:hypothetical protein